MVAGNISHQNYSYFPECTLLMLLMLGPPQTKNLSNTEHLMTLDVFFNIS